MTIEQISDAAKQLKKKYDETDPERLAEQMKILVSREAMGLFEGCCKGFFLIHSRCKIAVVNSELEDLVQRVILAHELAHGVLHVDSKIRTFHELSYLDDRDFMEREANIFAAEFLVDDTDLFDTLQSHTDFFSVASSLNVPPELLDFKLRLLEKRDGRFQAPYLAQSDFLRRDISKPLC